MSLVTGSPGDDSVRIAELEQEVKHLRHGQLTQRDYAVGSEAERAALRREIEELRVRAERAEHALREIYASHTWRVGQFAARPLHRARRMLRRG